jgi:uncharacterized protein (TIGR02145 family)
MKRIFAFLSTLLLTLTINAQSPDKFKYQAVIRNTDDSIKANQSVNIQIGILQSNSSNFPIYIETHFKTTTSLGLVNLVIGDGTVVTGSISGIDWSAGPYYIKIWVDGIEMGTSQLLSVPYAKYAEKAGNEFSGNYNDLTNKPTLFVGNYSDLSNKPILFDGSWNSLSEKPSLFSGSYMDLSNRPVLFDSSWLAIKGKPQFSSIAFSGSYNDLLNLPALFSGSYLDLNNKPALFSGNYADLFGKPMLWDSTWYSIKNKPTTIVGFGITDAFNGQYSSLTGTPSLSTVATSGNYNDLTGKPQLYDSTYTSLKGIPILAKVATTGNYNDLTGSPDLFDSTYSSLKGVPVFAKVATTGKYNDLLNKPSLIDSVGNFAVLLSGNQTVAGNKSFITKITVPNPITFDDAVNKAYVDSLKREVDLLKGKLAILSNEAKTYATSDTSGIISDFEGNSYKYIKIGSQTWMTENLRATKFNDGTPISEVAETASWISQSSPAYCWYNNDMKTYKYKYGALYNKYVISAGQICPVSWHIPTDKEWTTLEMAAGGIVTGGGNLKESGYLHWISPNQGATNSTGFTATPGGSRYNDGSFRDLGYYGNWWLIASPYQWTRYLINTIPYLRQGFNFLQEGFSIRCMKDTGTLLQPSLYTLNTNAKELTPFTAISGGNITSDGGAAIISRGVCWNTTPSPVVTDSHTTDGIEIGAFPSTITGLSPNTSYYARAYATNATGTAYGNEITFTTLCVNTAVFNPNAQYWTMTDQDGNIYRFVHIDRHDWMAENLRVTKYRNGDIIPTDTSSADWANLITGATCTYSNTTICDSITTYGRLYNWYAATDSRNLAPLGWHVPSDAEWVDLQSFLDHQFDAMTELKEAGHAHWRFINNATNETGFTALPAGMRMPDGTFSDFRGGAYWWSTRWISPTEAYSRFMTFGRDFDEVWANKKYGMSIRLVKDY